MQTVFNINYKIDFIAQPLRPQPKPKPAQRFGWLPGLPKGKGQAKKNSATSALKKQLLNNLTPKTFIFMKESTKKTLKKVAEIVITIITALLTTLGAHATIC